MPPPDPPNNDPSDLNEALREHLRLQQENKAERAARLQDEKELLEAALERNKASLSAAQTLRANNEIRLATIEMVRSQNELQREQIRNGQEVTEEELRQLEIRERRLELDREAAVAMANTATQTQNLAAALTGVSDRWKETFLGGFVLAAQSDGIDGLTDRIKEFGFELKNTFSLTNILASGLMRVHQSTMALAAAQDSAIAAFNKTTSSMGEYNDQIMTIERSNIGLGISTQDSAKSFGSLLVGVTDFVRASPAVQTEMANTAAQMEKLGVSTDLTAKTWEYATRVMGLGATEAQELSAGLAAMADQMGLPIEQVTEGFNAAGPALAKFGTDAIDVFNKVQVASKSLGVSVSDLLGVMGQFDTFRGAADAAGSLNAILGGDLLNSAELLLATEDQRLRLVRESLAMSGKNFATMDRFERQAVATALGVSDVATATKMLTGDMDAFGNAMDANPLTKEETEERIRKTQAVTDKLAETWRLFAISMRPLVEMLHGFLEGIFELNKMLEGKLALYALGAAGILKFAKAIQAARAASLLLGPALKSAFLPLTAAVTGLLLGVTIGEKFMEVWGKSGTLAAGVLALAAALGTLWVMGTGGAAAVSIAAGLAMLGLGMIATATGAFGGEGANAGAGGAPGIKFAADGGFVSGPTIVGEKGPELLMLPPRSNVINNDNFVRAMAQPSSGPAQQGTSGPQKQGDTTVVIKIGNQEMGRAVIKAIESVPGYNLRGLPRGA